MKIAILTGIPGVGKTTILEKIKSLSRDRGYRIEIVNFGDYMLKEAISRGLVKDRDEIRKLTLRTQQELQSLASKSIVNRANELENYDSIIVDTHSVVMTPTGYWPGLPKHVIEILRPHVIFLIEASPNEIISRQQRDNTRRRQDYSSLEVVREVMEFARSFAVASATLVGASVKIILNREGQAEQASLEVLKVLEAIG